jgi:dinuclear metal center YbgI/SA1388 family protein
LQVEGRAEVRRIATGVSACDELFRRAIEFEADTVLVHHGLLWRSDGNAPITGLRFRRLRTLIRAELSLLAYHLPLDAHPTLGNNALAAQLLGLEQLEPFGRHEGAAIGLRGRFAAPITADALRRRVEDVFGQPPLWFAEGPDPVSTLGLVSGAAQREFHQAIDLGLDAYLTGEASEWVQNVAREARVHYFAAGHHATERFGIRALGEHLARHFGVEATFVDVPNPV